MNCRFNQILYRFLLAQTLGIVVVMQALGQDEIIRIDANMVSVPVSVSDRDGRYLRGLRKDNFSVFENAVGQEITYFAETDEPFTVFLLLDRSGSMSYRMEDLAMAASEFIRQLRASDSVLVASFADSVTEVMRQRRVSEIPSGLKITQRRDERNTYIFDAVDHALKKLNKIPGRKALVLFSDGAGHGLTSSEKGNFRDAEEGQALIYTMRFDTFAGEPTRAASRKAWLEATSSAKAYMTELASRTGGRSYRIETLADLTATFRAVAEELGRVYSLGYSPLTTGKDGERRKITVKVNVPNVAVRSRNEVVFKKK